jgi:cobyrinic acid a,c-diamide synthase
VKAGASIPVVMIAGAASGVGKTTLTLGLLEALRRRGLRVQAFKVGPDFIDPAFHALATGRPAYTLDGWMCGGERVIETVGRRAADADLAVVEGMMGCFDGLDGETDEGSTAQVAKWLGAPVVLTVDAGALARSAGAVVLGFERFDPDLDLAGVVFNRAGGALHRRWLAQAVAGACRARVLGAMPHADAAALPERHLGLVTAAEGGYTEALGDTLAALAEAHVDVDAIIAMARSTVRRLPPAAAAPARRARIAVARDEAFQFYYAENLDLLRGAGAELVFWSPLGDSGLPEADGLYLGGGYPELHASRLAANAGMRRAVRTFAASGRPVYAECGGLMYLCDSLEDAGGASWPMVGVLPARARWAGGPLCLGYREVETQAASLLGPAGTRIRGHEFHCSSLEPASASATCVYRVEDGLDGPVRSEGYAVGGALMSYVHLHWGSNPAVAERFVETCRR